MWETIKENLSAFFNMPITEIMTAILTVCVFALVIFAKTSFGKKAIIKLTAKYQAMKEAGESIKRDNEAHKAETDAKIEALKSDYEGKLEIVLSYAQTLEETLIAVGEATPNKKVNELARKFAEGKAARLREIAEKVPSLAQLDEIKAQVGAAEEKAKAQVDDYKALYEAKTKEAEEFIAKLEERAQKAFVAISEVDHEQGKDTQAD